MKCQNVFSGKNKKNISICCLLIINLSFLHAIFTLSVGTGKQCRLRSEAAELSD